VRRDLVADLHGDRAVELTHLGRFEERLLLAVELHEDRVAADLHDLVEDPAAERALERCGTLYVPNHRPVPNLAYWTSRPPGEVRVPEPRQPPAPGGLFVAPANPEAARLSILDPRDRTAPATPPADYRPVARNRSWALYAGCRP
jgi:hypothetical protein